MSGEEHKRIEIGETSRSPAASAERDAGIDYYRLMVDALPAQVALLDGEGRIIFVNGAWRRFADANGGSDADFCLGHNYLKVCEAARGACAGEAFQIRSGILAVLREGAPSFKTEYACHSPTQERWIRIIVTPVDLHGERGAVVSHVDVTDLKQAKDELLASEARLERAQAVASIGSWEIDAPTGRVVWSRQMYRGRSIALGTALTVDSFLDGIDGSDRDAATAWFARLGAGEAVEPLDLRLSMPDGEARIVNIEGRSVRGPDGEVIRIDGTERDVTAQRRVERTAREDFARSMHAQKLASLDAVTGEIAHELNNALVPIISMAELCLDAVRDDEDLAQNLDLILKAGLGASFFVRKILAFGRSGSRAGERFSVKRTVDDVLSLMRSVAPRAISIVGDVRAEPMVIGDPTQIHQIVLHLVTNAIEAIGSADGLVSVVLSVKAGSAPDDARHLVLAVGDSGSGIDAATIPRIFEPFFSTKEPAVSRGLGLSIVHGIVSSLGGKIEVTSEPGQGASFVVMLPLAEDDTVGSRLSACDLGSVE